MDQNESRANQFAGKRATGQVNWADAHSTCSEDGFAGARSGAPAARCAQAKSWRESVAGRSMNVVLAATLATSMVPTAAFASTGQNGVTEGSTDAQAAAGLSEAEVLAMNENLDAQIEPQAQDASRSQSQSQTRAVATLDAQSQLDYANLADGQYTVKVRMINASNFNQDSMSNSAVGNMDADRNHDVTIDVVNGTYYVTLNFVGMSILGSYGYLGKLYYYDQGWTWGDYKQPKGDYKLATVLSRQKDADGNDIYDSFNTPDSDYYLPQFIDDTGLYPAKMQFPIVQQAINNINMNEETEGTFAYVPLRVSVPVMGSIQLSSGEQNCYMRVNWDTLQVNYLSTDKVALGESLTSAKALEQGKKSDDAWKTLQDAIMAAQGVYDDAASSQDAINAAATELAAAIEAFNNSEDQVASDPYDGVLASDTRYQTAQMFYDADGKAFGSSSNVLGGFWSMFWRADAADGKYAVVMLDPYNTADLAASPVATSIEYTAPDGSKKQAEKICDRELNASNSRQGDWLIYVDNLNSKVEVNVTYSTGMETKTQVMYLQPVQEGATETSSLLTALQGTAYMKNTGANFAPLYAAIQTAKAVEQGKKTDEAWTTLQSAIEAAQTTLDTSSSKQDALDEAVTALNAAVEAFASSPDSTSADATYGLEKGVWYTNSTEQWSGEKAGIGTDTPFSNQSVLYKLNEDGTFTVRVKTYKKFNVTQVAFGEDKQDAPKTGQWNAALGSYAETMWDLTVSDLSQVTAYVTGKYQNGTSLVQEPFVLTISGLAAGGDYGFVKAAVQLDDGALYQAWARGKACVRDTSKLDAYQQLQSALSAAESIRSKVKTASDTVTQADIDAATERVNKAIEAYEAPVADPALGMEKGVFYGHFRLDDAVTDASGASVTSDGPIAVGKSTFRLTDDGKFEVTLAFPEISGDSGVSVESVKAGTSSAAADAVTPEQIGGGAGLSSYRFTVDSLTEGIYVWATYTDAAGTQHAAEQLLVKLDLSNSDGDYGFTKLANQDDTRKDLYAQLAIARALTIGNKTSDAWDALQQAISAAETAYADDAPAAGNYTEAANTLRDAIDAFNNSADTSVAQKDKKYGLTIGTWYELKSSYNRVNLSGSLTSLFYRGMFHYLPKADDTYDIDLYAFKLSSKTVTSVKYSAANNVDSAKEALKTSDNYWRINVADPDSVIYTWVTYVDDEGAVHENVQMNITHSGLKFSEFSELADQRDKGLLYAAYHDADSIEYGKKPEALWVSLFEAKSAAAKILKDVGDKTQADIDAATESVEAAAEAYRTAADDPNGGKYGFELGYHYRNWKEYMYDANGDILSAMDDANPFYYNTREYSLNADGTFNVVVEGLDKDGMNAVTAVKWSMTDDESTAKSAKQISGKVGSYTPGPADWKLSNIDDISKPIYLWVSYIDPDGGVHANVKVSIELYGLSTAADHCFIGYVDGVDTTQLYLNLKEAEKITKDETKSDLAWLTFDLCRETNYIYYVNKAGADSQANVDAAAQSVANAITTYKNSESIDRSALNAAIAEAQQLVDAGAGDMQDKAFELLSAQLEAAKAVAADGNNGQSAIDETKDALVNVTDAYKASATKTSAAALKAKLDEANELKAGGSLNGLAPLSALNKAIKAAQGVYDEATGFADDKIAGTEAGVAQAVTDLEAAIEAFKQANIVDKEALKAKIDEASALAKGNKTDAAWEKLQQALSAAQKQYDNPKASQVMVNGSTTNLTNAIEEFKSSPDVIVIDKTKLSTAIADAKKIEQGKKSNEAFQELQKAISAAQDVADNDEATQDAIDAAVSSLNEAVRTFNASPDVSDALDFANLADGVYTVNVDMYKLDRTSLSMSNDAINHEVELEVKNGEYFLTFDFKGLKYLGKFGYLGFLKYYENGYTYSKWGSPEGTLAEGTVLTTQKNADGSDVYDEFNSTDSSSKLFDGLYPDKVQIKYVQTARDDIDGYIPLQVFVPVMESIAAGNGTQDVLAKVDKASLAKKDAQAADKSQLSDAIDAAKNIEQGKKTDEAWDALQDAISKAEDALDKSGVSQADVDAAATELAEAVDTFNKSADKTEGALDFANLPAGTYSINIDMYKMNRVDKSMSDGAIDHKVKLEVDANGEYWLTFDFKGVASIGYFGYLGSLSYYDAGYSYSGAKVNGTTVAGTVLDVQKDGSGNEITDDFRTKYNNNAAYPNHVKVKFVKTAREDADHFIPLQVYVPVMESIAAGGGTQDVLAKYDVSSIAVAKDSDFTDNKNMQDELDNNNNVDGPTKVTPSTATKSGITAATAQTAAAAKLAKTGDTAGVLATAFAGVAAAAAAAFVAARRRFGKQAVGQKEGFGQRKGGE